jgi:N-6 DNA Methylase/TaqI-like C-terminal specificity domain
MNERVSNRYNSFFERWPDPALNSSFRDLFTVYDALINEPNNGSQTVATRLVSAYEVICQLMVETGVHEPKLPGHNDSFHKHRRAIEALLLNLKATRKEWLQSVASLLAMLMHFSIDNRRASVLANRRRPQKICSTYPNSPAVARFMGDEIVKGLLKEELPLKCRDYGQAQRYAEMAFDFKVFDPSMESGQLLLEIALASIRMIHRRHSSDSIAAQYLVRATLKKICHDSLWGVDRNNRASVAVQTIFALLGLEFEIPNLRVEHLFIGNSLSVMERNKLPVFDGLINNPPWGEFLSHAEKKKLRTRVCTLHHRFDTYIAFSELALQLLRQDGRFTLILPSQVIASRNATRLRELLARQTVISRMMLLPREAFRDSTARGILLFGKMKPKRISGNCHIVVFPFAKKINPVDVPQRRTILGKDLRSVGRNSWMPLLSKYTEPQAKTIQLGSLAMMLTGVKLYIRGRGSPPQSAQVVRSQPFTFETAVNGTTRAIRGRDIHAFRVGESKRFIKLGKWLAWTGDHRRILVADRVFVRELCGHDGRITAAIAPKNHVPLHGVLTVIPQMIEIHVLVALLNSTHAAEFVRCHTASFSKVDFQRITISELAIFPIPAAAVGRQYRSSLGLHQATAKEVELCKRLNVSARCVSRLTSNSHTVGSLFAEVDEIVSAMYNLTNTAR